MPVYTARMNTHVRYRNFTTTLPEYILADLERAAHDLSVQRNAILIDAFVAWRKAHTQKMLAESYAKAAGDAEFQALAEEGFGDWQRRVSYL